MKTTVSKIIWKIGGRSGSEERFFAASSYPRPLKKDQTIAKNSGRRQDNKNYTVSEQEENGDSQEKVKKKIYSENVVDENAARRGKH